MGRNEQKLMGKMMKKRLILIACEVLLSLCVLSQAYSFDHDNIVKSKKVLVVHSYSQEYVWVSTISRGIKRVFERSQDVQVETFYMDTKSKTSEEWKNESGRRARKIIYEWSPDVVIVVDDNAQEYVGKFYGGMESPKIVFCGVNEKAEKYGYPSSNITGILERPHIEETLDLLEKFVPSMERIGVISDNSPTSRGAFEYIKEQFQKLDKKVVAYEMPVTFEHWKSSIKFFQKNVDAVLVYLYHTVKRDGHLESMIPKEVMEWTVSKSSIPVAGFFTFSIDDGALLGVVESGLEQGIEAARVAVGLLNGKNIKQFPIKTSEKGIVMFNKQTADKLGILLNDQMKGQIDITVGE